MPTLRKNPELGYLGKIFKDNFTGMNMKKENLIELNGKTRMI